VRIRLVDACVVGRHACRKVGGAELVDFTQPFRGFIERGRLQQVVLHSGDVRHDDDHEHARYQRDEEHGAAVDGPADVAVEPDERLPYRSRK
jgi:hypothetical protein